MDLQPLIDRLRNCVPELGQRVADAAALATLVAAGGQPQVTPAAHVVPAGIAGGNVLSFTGAYVQAIERMFSVILTVRTQDASGARALPQMAQLIDKIIAALAGWDLGLHAGVIVFRRADLLSAATGTFTYALQFSLSDQLRIIPT